ncbi:MAG: hypothetical protein Q8L29_02115 [archaeon]|nr:hypothetical protein [archaeon]
MKTALSKTQAKEKIDSFFQGESFTAEEVKKIKRLAMKFNIKLGAYRKLFCKKCLSKLKGKLRIAKTHKIVECASCGYKNKIKIR